TGAATARTTRHDAEKAGHPWPVPAAGTRRRRRPGAGGACRSGDLAHGGAAVILLVPILAAAVGALYGLIAGALTGLALAALRSYALRARRRVRTIGFVMSAAPWVLAARLEGFPVSLLAGAISGAAG